MTLPGDEPTDFGKAYAEELLARARAGEGGLTPAHALLLEQLFYNDPQVFSSEDALMAALAREAANGTTFAQEDGTSLTYAMFFDASGAAMPDLNHHLMEGHVNQEQQPDCRFLSLAGAMLQTADGRRHIEDIITDHGDGTYSVVFPAYPAITLTVTDADLEDWKGDRSSKGIQVLEKAYLDFSRYYLVTHNSAVDPSFMLTGSPTISIDLNDEKMLDYYIGHADRYLFVAASDYRFAPNLSAAENGMSFGEPILNHGYFFTVSTDRATGEAMFTVYNPWDSSAPAVVLDEEQFMQRFTSFAALDTRVLEGKTPYYPGIRDIPEEVYDSLSVVRLAGAAMEAVHMLSEQRVNIEKMGVEGYIEHQRQAAAEVIGQAVESLSEGRLPIAPHMDMDPRDILSLLNRDISGPITIDIGEALSSIPLIGDFFDKSDQDKGRG
ncbi:MAG: hypothetical protein IT567_01195 [Alphaproteobacteria bacterium]|nr:hypothetical protein [Alphaproteobacteria bacterium]